VLIGSAEMPVVQRYNLIHDILQFERVHDYWEVMLTKSSWEDVISEGSIFSSQVACYSIRHIDCLILSVMVGSALRAESLSGCALM
jgi:hypothetical protein